MKNRFVFRLFLMSLLTFIGLAAKAVDPIPFGPEFVFTNDLMIAQTTAPTQKTSPEGIMKMKQVKESLEHYCQESGKCVTKKGTVKGNPSIKVEFNDGFWIQVSHDPTVLEVTMLKGTLADYEARSELINELTFDLFAKLGMFVHDRIGGGHISMDVEAAFHGDAKLFRNFLVDFANHPELAWGVFGNHLGNAPPISALKAESKEAFYQVIQNFDKNPTSIKDLAEKMNRFVYTNNPYNWSGPDHYQAVRLNQVDGESGRVEMRGFAPQKSLAQFIKQGSVLERRIQYLSQFTYPIEVLIPKSAKQMSAPEKVARASQWFSEMNLKFEDYKDTMTAELQNVPGDDRLAPLVENKDSKGKIKDGYEGVEFLHSQLSAQKIQDVRAVSYNHSGKERYMIPYPKVISQEEKDLLKAGTEQRGRAFMAFLRDLQGEQNYIKAGHISMDLIQRVLTKNDTTWEAVKYRASAAMGFLLAPDVVKSSDGNYVILEDNISCNPGGLGDAAQSRKEFLEILPQYKTLFNADQAKGLPQGIAELLKAQEPGKAVVYVIPRSQKTYNQFFIQQLTAAGIHIVDRESDGWNRLDSSSGNVMMNRVNKSGQVVSRTPVGAILLRGFGGGEFRSEYPNTFKAALNGKVKLIGYSSFDFLSDKELSIYAEDMIEFYLKEKPLLRYAKTLTFRDIGEDNKTILKSALLEKVFSELNRWVIKDTTGLQGKGVWIGSQVTDAAALKKMIVENPGKYIAQEYIPVSRINKWITDIRIHSMVIGDQAVASDIFWGRALTVYGNGKLNVSQDAGVVPIFVKGRDTVNSEVPNAFSQLFLAENLDSLRKAMNKLIQTNTPEIDEILTGWFSERIDSIFEMGMKATDLIQLRRQPKMTYLINNWLGKKLDANRISEFDRALLMEYYKETSAEDKLHVAIASRLTHILKADLNEAHSSWDLLSRLRKIQPLLPEKEFRSLAQSYGKKFESFEPLGTERKQFTDLIGNKTLEALWKMKGQMKDQITIRCEQAL